MEFAVKFIGRILGPVMQAIGLSGVVIPAQTQEGIVYTLLNSLVSPYVFIPFVVVGTIITTTVYGSLWAEHKLKVAGGTTGKEFPSNLDSWDRVQNFPVWQVAWLWSDLEPQASDVKTEGTNAYPTFRKLKEDLNNDRIKDAKKVNDSWLWTTLSRQQLIDYALGIGEQPKFLFPEQRGWTLFRVARSWLSKELPYDKIYDFESISDLRTSMYSYFLDKGQQVSGAGLDQVIQKWLVDGEWEAIGRRDRGGLLFCYEKISNKQWKKLRLDFVGASADGISYRDIRLRQIAKESHGNVAG